jgi:nucleolar protein 56
MLPNTTYLTDEKIAAEMLSKAGSLERLATMPASTIQLLGAEKSLFKHIKFGSKPPKYGILFKMPVVNSASKDTRGRIARVYATKISVGLKADYYTKRFIAKELKKSLDEAIERIRAAPVKERKPSPQGQGPKGFRPKQGFKGKGPQRFKKHNR